MLTVFVYVAAAAETVVGSDENEIYKLTLGRMMRNGGEKVYGRVACRGTGEDVECCKESDFAQ